MNRSRAARSLRLVPILALCACDPEPAGTAQTAPNGWPVAVERSGKGEPAYERVVLVTIDTLRADHVSCYGYPRATTPFLDSLAARGGRFTRALAAVSHTAPSHASMLTGLVPAVHGVLRNGERLPAAALDLAGLFGSAGFESAAFLNANFLRGIAGSFAHVEVRGAGAGAQDGGDVVDAALAWLERERKGARFFLWVHLYDPHEWQRRMFQDGVEREPLWSGATPADFFERLVELHGLPPPAPDQAYTVDWGTDRKLAERIQDASVETFLHGIDAYDERTLFADRQVARLYAALEALALAGPTLWIVTSDHGEGLASHATTGHGARIYQEQLHVPLIVHASDGSLAPRRVDELVAHIDLLPTLAETLGLRLQGVPALYEGRSLWPLLRGEPGAWAPRPIFAQRRPAEDPADPDQAAVYALQTERHKLILHEPGAQQFFDLAADPRELSDLGPEHAGAAELRAALAARLRLYDARPAGAGEAVPEEFARELRELGY